MEAAELIKFLKLLRSVGGLNGYWKERINQIILRLGGQPLKKKRQSLGIAVQVEDGKFEKAMRLFKKKIEESGLLKDLKEREEYVKPSIQRKLDRNAAKRRWKKKLQQDKLPTKLY